MWFTLCKIYLQIFTFIIRIEIRIFLWGPYVLNYNFTLGEPLSYIEISWVKIPRRLHNWILSYIGINICIAEKKQSLGNKSKSKLYYDRQSVGQSVLVSGAHLGPATNFSPAMFNYFRQLQVCWCGRPLWREVASVFFFFCRVSPNTPFLRSESHGTHENILLSLFLRLPQSESPSSCNYIPQEQGNPVIPLGIGFV
jgi:hypothetical protein